MAGFVLLAAMLACNMPFEQTAAAGETQTAAALTVEAVITPSLASTTAPAPTAETPSSTGSPAETAQTITITPTYSLPMQTVIEQTNCRTGPGEDYEVIFTYLSGKKLEIVGRYDPGNFWLVKSSETPTGICWLWGQYVEVTGSYWVVSSVTPPATSTQRPPQAPSIIEWSFSCGDGTITFSVNWKDNENNETGYRIFRNGELAVELPANSTTYTDLFAVAPDQSMEYYLQVHGTSGAANSSMMRMKC